MAVLGPGQRISIIDQLLVIKESRYAFSIQVLFKPAGALIHNFECAAEKNALSLFNPPCLSIANNEI